VTDRLPLVGLYRFCLSRMPRKIPAHRRRLFASPVPQSVKDGHESQRKSKGWHGALPAPARMIPRNAPVRNSKFGADRQTSSCDSCITWVPRCTSLFRPCLKAVQWSFEFHGGLRWRYFALAPPLIAGRDFARFPPVIAGVFFLSFAAKHASATFLVPAPRSVLGHIGKSITLGS
jgi:hypothetical protein